MVRIALDGTTREFLGIGEQTVRDWLDAFVLNGLARLIHLLYFLYSERRAKLTDSSKAGIVDIGSGWTSSGRLSDGMLGYCPPFRRLKPAGSLNADAIK